MHSPHAEILDAGVDSRALIFSGRGERKCVSPETVLFSEGDTATGVYLLHSGSIELRHNISPDLTSSRISGVGEILGVMPVISGSRHSSSAITQSECVIEFIEDGLFWRIVDDSPAGWLTVLQQLSSELNESYDLVRTVRE